MALVNGSVSQSVENEEGDFFAYVLEDTASKRILVITWVLGTVFSVPMLAGLISFKNLGTLNYQTLIDKLNAYFYAILLTFSLSGFNTLILRMFWKLPRIICIIKIVQWNSYVAALSISATEVHILRYLYIGVWKNVGALNDDLFGKFFFIFNSVITIGQGCLILVTQDYLGLELDFCEGVDPSKYAQIHKSWNLTVIFSFLCCLIALIIILLVTVAVKKQSQNAMQVQNTLSTTSMVYDMRKLLETAITLVVLITLCLQIYVSHMYSSGKVRLITPWVLALSQTSMHFIVIFLLPLSVYLSHKGLRKHVMKLIMDTDLAQAIQLLIHKSSGQVAPS